MRIALFGLIAFGLLLLALLWYVEHNPQTAPAPAPAETQSADTLTIRDTVVHIETVSTPEAMERGLSGRTSLADDTGMFFVFEKSDLFGIWMPNMQFAIDVLWLDEAMRVVYIVENMSPESYPKVFTPTSPARYILEVPAGFVKAHGVQVGDQAQVSLARSLKEL